MQPSSMGFKSRVSTIGNHDKTQRDSDSTIRNSCFNQWESETFRNLHHPLTQTSPWLAGWRDLPVINGPTTAQLAEVPVRWVIVVDSFLRKKNHFDKNGRPSMTRLWLDDTVIPLASQRVRFARQRSEQGISVQAIVVHQPQKLFLKSARPQGFRVFVTYIALQTHCKIDDVIWSSLTSSIYLPYTRVLL